MDNGKTERVEPGAPVSSENWSASPVQRSLGDIGRKAIFSPEATTTEPTTAPEIEIIPMSEDTPATPVHELAFDPADIHPNHFDLSAPTEAAVEDVMRIPSPSKLMDNYQAMRELYTAADAQIEGYNRYTENIRKKAA